jgi:hypothetical protein
LLEALSSLLPKGRSWHSESDTWGTEDGDRFDVVRDGRRIAEVRGRLDVRNLSLSYLNRVIDIARENGLLIVTESRHVLRPSVKELLAAIHRSPSFSFVGDPAAFLDRLSGAD